MQKIQCSPIMVGRKKAIEQFYIYRIFRIMDLVYEIKTGLVLYQIDIRFRIKKSCISLFHRTAKVNSAWKIH